MSDFKFKKVAIALMTAGALVLTVLAPAVTPATTYAATTESSTSSTLVEDFVERMYTVALGRESDATGKANWVNVLKAGTHDGAGIAKEFILGDEFKGRNLSDEEYVDVLYSTFFNRTADAEGRTLWLNVLASGQTREFVLSNFVNLDEFTNLCDSFGISRGIMIENGVPVKPGMLRFVNNLYEVVMERKADSGGLYDWTKVITLNEEKPTAALVAQNFFNSEEYALKNTNTTDFICALYKVFMGREADESGLAFWKACVDENGVTRDWVISEFAKSNEFEMVLNSFSTPSIPTPEEPKPEEPVVPDCTHEFKLKYVELPEEGHYESVENAGTWYKLMAHECRFCGRYDYTFNDAVIHQEEEEEKNGKRLGMAIFRSAYLYDYTDEICAKYNVSDKFLDYDNTTFLNNCNALDYFSKGTEYPSGIEIFFQGTISDSFYVVDKEAYTGNAYVCELCGTVEYTTDECTHKFECTDTVDIAEVGHNETVEIGTSYYVTACKCQTCNGYFFEYNYNDNGWNGDEAFHKLHPDCEKYKMVYVYLYNYNENEDKTDYMLAEDNTIHEIDIEDILDKWLVSVEIGDEYGSKKGLEIWSQETLTKEVYVVDSPAHKEYINTCKLCGWHVQELEPAGE